MTIEAIQKEVNDALIEQVSIDSFQKETIIDHYKQTAQSYVKVEQSVAVLTNYQDNYSYIFAGAFGSVFGMKSGSTYINSAFEDDIFNKIHSDDLLERHVLELRYFHFLKTLSPEDRYKYSTHSYIRTRNADGIYKYITHRTYFLTSLSNGIIWLALCTYSPCLEQNPRKGIEGKIVNNENGEILPAAEYIHCDKMILSEREIEILREIAVGKGSKEIASELYISPYTVYRHRQNLIRKLKVSNSAEAVKTALLMGLITI
ncbi:MULTISPECIES: LuxR C-terminal-related transcriptional regulator [Bacteroidales]|uniref:response regulator transcription factor n=1 Tax=Bacteroidales TaxID=171549 RepID=UPI0013D14D48|nr:MULTISPECIES: LuxR C-terminal-related transcriptional regulator [Bacteroidales]